MSTPDPPDPTSATGGGRAGASLSAEDRVWEVETWDAIRSRRNVRSHAEGTIASEDVDRILEAGRRTPRPATSRPGTSSYAPTPSSSRS
jgi:hypothetical protein